MVKISTLDYSAYLCSEKMLVAPNVQHAFPYRSCTLGQRFFNRYYSILRKYPEQTPIWQKRVLYHLDKVEYMQKALASGEWESRYYEIFPGIYADHIDLFEALGATASSRKFQGVYTLVKFIPEIIAFVCSADPKSVREAFEQNCEKLNLPVYDVCVALAMCDQFALAEIPAEIFKSLCTALDVVIGKLTTTATVLNFGPVSADLSTRSPEDRIMTFMLYHIATAQQMIFNSIIRMHMEDRESDGTPYLTSKGVGMLTFQSYEMGGLAPVQVQLGDQEPFTVHPTFVLRRMFTVQYAEGKL